MRRNVARVTETADAARSLQDVLDPTIVLSDPDLMAGYVHDEAEWAPYEAPLAVVRARTATDVQAVVRWAIEHQAPVVARGAGTGLSGGANSVAGCIVVSLDRMDAVREIDPLERLAVVEPGVINDHLRKAVSEHGLWYPPDPASSPWSTMGGNVATNAGGMCCVKYGVTRDYIRELEVVTGTGEIVRLGRRTAKGVSGLDLMSLVVGSEGTLGIVTEITVRLLPLPDPGHTVVGYFDDLVAAGEAVRAIAMRGLTPAALELVDKTTLEAVDDYAHLGIGAAANVVLIGRIDDGGEVGPAGAATMREVFAAAGATFTAEAADAEEAEAMMASRRLAYPALERLGEVLTEDVCVPKAAVPQMLQTIADIGTRHDITIANIAHAGDGNLHPLMLIERGDVAAKERAQLAFTAIIDAALEVGGTVTGEHGVGLLKRPGMERELGPEVLAMQRAVKAALDPHGILNPGKAV